LRRKPRAQVDETICHAAWDEGAAMTDEQAIEYALEEMGVWLRG
jgi:hypothetical protein